MLGLYVAITAKHISPVTREDQVRFLF